jgi:hypothetical protein
MLACGNVYSGKSFPQFHGVKCAIAQVGHSCRHRNATDPRLGGVPLAWWDETQKIAVRKRRDRNGGFE